MISLDFDLNEKHNNLDVHKLDEGTVLVAHNGFSYTRILLDYENLKKLYEKIETELKSIIVNKAAEALGEELLPQN